jgi:tRNA-2-methylthio-N6-dimethylallyladenosine synthase
MKRDDNNPNFQLPDLQAAKLRTRQPGRIVHGVLNCRKAAGISAKNRFYWLRTYGCQANVRDSETLAGMLQDMGFQPAETAEDADVLIFNTCAVRRNAEEHVLGEIGNLKHLKQENPDVIFAIGGCMAQEESVVRELLEKYPQVDLIFGTHNLHRFPELLYHAMLSHEKTVEVYSEEGEVVEDLPVRRTCAYKSFVNIMYGCNKFCTYCIVPYTRGRERSRSEEDILAEIRAFKAEGGREIQLLGQNVNAYGKDLGREDGFTALLESAAATGIDRIRFYTSHPRDYSVTTIAAMQKYPNIMKALHLPVQSGSDEVLKRMNRGYTADHFRELVGTMKEMIPEITLTTDLIVGFPSETDAQFEETLKLVDDCEFDSAFTFIYSPREGTPAAAMKDDIPMAVKKDRLQVLNERIGMHARRRNEQYLHRQLEVLCDGPSRNNPDVMAGYSRENKLVNFTGEGIREGDLVLVEVTEAKSYSLDATAVRKI